MRANVCQCVLDNGGQVHSGHVWQRCCYVRTSRGSPSLEVLSPSSQNLKNQHTIKKPHYATKNCPCIKLLNVLNCTNVVFVKLWGGSREPMGHPSKWHFLSHLSRDEILGITKGLLWKRFWGKIIIKILNKPLTLQNNGLLKNWGRQKTNLMF